MTVKNAAIIFAAGTGEHLKHSSKPKQFLELFGKPVLAYTIEHFQRHRAIDGIVLVTLKGWTDYCAERAVAWHFDKLAAIELGGSTSQDSIRIGLETARKLYDEDVAVLIHDGVRPLMDEKKTSANVCTAMAQPSRYHRRWRQFMIEEKAGGSCRIVDRERCRVARVPQCFYFNRYALHSVEGPLENIKITTNFDFQIFRVIMESHESMGSQGLHEEMPGVHSGLDIYLRIRFCAVG